MKRIYLAAIMAFISLALMGCGHDHSSAPPPSSTVITQILSDPVLDGYILQSPPGVFTTAQINTQRVFAGIDPLTPLAEDRAFLDFPLSTVPINAGIVSATLVIFINDIQPTTGTIPILIELASFSSLNGLDFDSTPLSTPSTFPIFQTDINNFVSVDVTSLMTQAQNLALSDFQIRLLLDFSATSGHIEINDTTGPNRAALAPLLVVEYF
jgi:hypothetical protein